MKTIEIKVTLVGSVDVDTLDQNTMATLKKILQADLKERLKDADYQEIRVDSVTHRHVYMTPPQRDLYTRLQVLLAYMERNGATRDECYNMMVLRDLVLSEAFLGLPEDVMTAINTLEYKYVPYKSMKR